MGIRGLMSFLEHKSPHTEIDVLRQIRFWKRDDKNSPVIVIDFIALTYSLFDFANDFVVGARLGIIFDHFDNLLKQLKDLGAELVFFYRLSSHRFSGEWMARCRQKFALNTKIYDDIRSGKSSGEISTFIDSQEAKLPPLALSELNGIAKKYGECHYMDHCDREMALFAKRNNARAIVSDSSEFYIFEGDWKFWSAKDFRLVGRNQKKIKTIQFDRSGIVKVCGIDAMHRPLFATLIGNDHAGGLRSELKQFRKSLGKDRFKKLAQYAKNAKRNINGSLDFERISEEVFGVCEDKYISYLESSTDSYNLDKMLLLEEEPHEMIGRLSSTQYHRDILMIMTGYRILTFSFYDLRGRFGPVTLPELLLKWDQRKSGILSELCGKELCINVFAKFKLHEDFHLKPSEPIKPEFGVPAIEDLYFSSEASDVKWQMLAFIMELNDAIVAAIESLPREFRLVCTTLVVLLKGGFCTEDEADGILLTMFMVETDEETVRKTQHSSANVIDEHHVRTAYIFLNTVDHVRQNFSIAGLLSQIQTFTRFDGVYFQYVMGFTKAERTKLMSSGQSYRIYNEK